MFEHSCYFREGVEDYKRGIKRDGNPYKGAVSEPEWEMGWMHAALENNDIQWALEDDGSEWHKKVKEAGKKIGEAIRDAYAKSAARDATPSDQARDAEK